MSPLSLSAMHSSSPATPPDNVYPTVMEQVAPLRDAMTGTSRSSNAPQISHWVVSACGAQFRQMLAKRMQACANPERAFVKAAEQLELSSKVSRKARRYGEDLVDQSVMEFTSNVVGEATSVEYANAFVQAARIMRARQGRRFDIKKLMEGEHDVSSLALPAGSDVQYRGEAVDRNHAFLHGNLAGDNYLRLIGAREEVEYDLLHQWNMYLFTNATRETQFAHHVAGYRNGPSNDVALIEGKDLLEIGPGNGADVRFFLDRGANSIHVVDGSPLIIERLKRNRDTFPEDLKSRLSIPAEGEDMFDALRHFESENRSFDTVSAHSCIHYFDDERLLELLSLIHGRLRPDGHFAAAVKAPGATLDGNGILLYEDVLPPSNPHLLKEEDEPSFVRGRMWLNHDGQTRIFRSRRAWVRLLENYFDVVSQTEAKVENYETPGRSQTFYDFVCRAKTPEELEKLQFD